MKKSKQFRFLDTQHLARSVLLEEAGIPVLMRVVVLFSATLFGLFLIWAFLVSVDEVAVAPGEIITQPRTQKIQHWQGGIVQEILVEEGDTVQVGQMLMRFDTFLSNANFHQTRVRLELLMAQKERLMAFLDEREPNFEQLDIGDTDVVAAQRRLYEETIKSWKTSQLILNDKLRQIRAEKTGLDARQIEYEGKKRSMGDELDRRSKWRDLIPHSEIDQLGLARALQSFEGSLRETEAEQKKTSYMVSEFSNRLIELNQDVIRAALSDLAQTNIEMYQMQEQVDKNRHLIELGTLRAPIEGLVHGIRIHTIGGVVRGGDVLLEIVPLQRELVAEVRISARDIGHVQIGQPAIIKLLTYDFGRYGGLKGELISLSPTSYTDDPSTPFHKGIVRLSANHIGIDPTRNKLLPGMTLNADIRTGSKTVMTYLLKPIYASAQQAFRER
jgi:adhesin transport system membrane fusion protein